MQAFLEQEFLPVAPGNRTESDTNQRTVTIPATKRLIRSAPCSSAGAITQMNAVGLPTFLQPSPVVKKDSYRVVKTTQALEVLSAWLLRSVTAIAGLSFGKLPYRENYEIVARATTLPLLAAESVGDLQRLSCVRLLPDSAAGANCTRHSSSCNVLMAMITARYCTGRRA